MAFLGNMMMQQQAVNAQQHNEYLAQLQGFLETHDAPSPYPVMTSQGISTGMFGHEAPRSALQEAIVRTGPFFVADRTGRTMARSFSPEDWSPPQAAAVARLHVPVQVPPPVPYVPPPPPPRDPWKGHDGKDAAAFILAYAFQEPCLPDGWREPTWHDAFAMDARAVPGYARQFRIPGLPPKPVYSYFAVLDAVACAVNFPLAVTGHIINDVALAVCAFAGVTILSSARRLAQANAPGLS